jgi:uncharacterized protein YndB with AHSA1/START domain
MENQNKITVQTLVNAPIEHVWICWTSPEHIIQWNNASPDWHTPHAENDLRVGGQFLSRMEAKDGTFGFDFGGTYTKVVLSECIEYVLGDERTVSVQFREADGGTVVTETFDPEKVNPHDMQRLGWQSILDNFKRHAEENK